MLIITRVSWIAFIFLAIKLAQMVSGFTDVPRKLKKNLD
jgi:hypothetical protein